MCPNRARAATALAASAALALLLAASPASAGLFSKAKKPQAPAAAAPAPQAGGTNLPAAEQPRRAVKASPAERAAADRLDPLARAAFWARESQADPVDTEAATKLSASLRALGRYPEAVEAADQALVLKPDDLELLLESARAKIGGEQAFYAIETLKHARALAPRDWRPVSLLGVAYQETERPAEAEAAYQEALKLSPDNAAVLSNLAMFDASRGRTGEAETLLRRAAVRPDATARERQNLALVLGLEGKMAEAERLMREDLPPQLAEANLAYLRANPAGPPPGAAQARNWSSLEGAQATAGR